MHVLVLLLLIIGDLSRGSIPPIALDCGDADKVHTLMVISARAAQENVSRVGEPGSMVRARPLITRHA